MSARSITFCNSRTFPGQAQAFSSPLSSSVSSSKRRPMRSAKRRPKAAARSRFPLHAPAGREPVWGRHSSQSSSSRKRPSQISPPDCGWSRRSRARPPSVFSFLPMAQTRLPAAREAAWPADRAGVLRSRPGTTCPHPPARTAPPAAPWRP